MISTAHSAGSSVESVKQSFCFARVETPKHGSGALSQESQGCGLLGSAVIAFPSSMADPVPDGVNVGVPDGSEGLAQSMRAVASSLQMAAQAMTVLGAPPERTGGMGEAARVLKPPEIWKPKNMDDELSSWNEWSFIFRSFLCFGDSRYAEELKMVEDNLTDPLNIESFNADTKERAYRLHSMLCNFVRGRPLKLVRSIQDQNGFAAWQLLQREFSPQTRVRILALSNAIVSFPVFGKNTLEGILQFERLIQEFETATKSEFPAELKIATLVRCVSPELRLHLQLNISERTSYQQDSLRSCLSRTPAIGQHSVFCRNFKLGNPPEIMMDQPTWTLDVWKETGLTKAKEKEKETKEKVKEKGSPKEEKEKMATKENSRVNLDMAKDTATMETTLAVTTAVVMEAVATMQAAITAVGTQATHGKVQARRTKATSSMAGQANSMVEKASIKVVQMFGKLVKMVNPMFLETAVPFCQVTV